MTSRPAKLGLKPYAFVLLFVIVLITPFILRQAVLRSAYVAAPAASAESLVIICPQPESIRREFNLAFSDWHQTHFGTPVTLDFRNYGGATEIVNFLTTSKPLLKSQGTLKIDLIWGGSDVLFNDTLKAQGFLQPVQIDPALMRSAYPHPDLGGLHLYDYDDKHPELKPQWFGVCLAGFGIACNNDVLQFLQLPQPKHWHDLTDPRYQGWVVCADPTQSGAAGQAFMVIAEKAMADAPNPDIGWARGMGTIRQIAANARLFTSGTEAVSAVVSSGNAAAGMTIDFYARSESAVVGNSRMSYLQPQDETAISPDPIAMVKGAEHPELAKQFIEFLLSEKGQRLWINRPGSPDGPRTSALYRLPIRPSVYQDQTNFLYQTNPFESTNHFNKSAAREKTFGILSTLIEVSCINLLDELRETRKQILASPRAAELDAQLGLFPFGQIEALHRAAQLKSATPLEALQLKRQWTQDFRNEYAQLRNQANPSIATFPTSKLSVER